MPATKKKPAPPKEAICDIEVMEFNVDSKYLTAGDYQNAMRACLVVECPCRAKTRRLTAESNKKYGLKNKCPEYARVKTRTE
jgi:hypothetical protein